MSTTIVSADSADHTPSIQAIRSLWAERAPELGSPVSADIDWYELAVELLRPITENPSHPEHDKARTIAFRAQRRADSLRNTEDGR